MTIKKVIVKALISILEFFLFLYNRGTIKKLLFFENFYTMKFILSNYTQFKLFLIICIGCYCSYAQYKLTKTVKIKLNFNLIVLL